MRTSSTRVTTGAAAGNQFRQKARKLLEDNNVWDRKCREWFVQVYTERVTGGSHGGRTRHGINGGLGTDRDVERLLSWLSSLSQANPLFYSRLGSMSGEEALGHALAGTGPDDRLLIEPSIGAERIMDLGDLWEVFLLKDA